MNSHLTIPNKEITPTTVNITNNSNTVATKVPQIPAVSIKQEQQPPITVADNPSKKTADSKVDLSSVTKVASSAATLVWQQDPVANDDYASDDAVEVYDDETAEDGGGGGNGDFADAADYEDLEGLVEDGEYIAGAADDQELAAAQAAAAAVQQAARAVHHLSAAAAAGGGGGALADEDRVSTIFLHFGII